jgi:hypothetical protein
MYNSSEIHTFQIRLNIFSASITEGVDVGKVWVFFSDTLVN